MAVAGPPGPSACGEPGWSPTASWTGAFWSASPQRRDSDDLVTRVTLAARTLKPPPLANPVRHLEGLHCRTPRGETQWSVSSV